MSSSRSAPSFPVPRVPALVAMLLVVATVVVAFPDMLPAQSEQDGAERQPPAPLSIGDEAPALEIGKWVRGKAVESFREGHIYVLDFWATWCEPCIRAIPHMTELQREHEDDQVHVIGVSVWESNPADVQPFVEKQADAMGYQVATDRVPDLPEGTEPGTRPAQVWAIENGAMSRIWMQAAGRDGIPTVFIVDRQGRIAWIGHPMDGMDEVLDAIVAGKHDVEEARRALERERMVRRTAQEFGQLVQQERFSEAFEIARAHVDEEWAGNAGLLNYVAWTIVDPEGHVEEDERDLDLAYRAAVKANELTGGKNAAILDTLARVHFVKGNLDRALELQRHAVERADGQLQGDLQEVLDEYREAAEKARKPERF